MGCTTVTLLHLPPPHVVGLIPLHGVRYESESMSEVTRIGTSGIGLLEILTTSSTTSQGDERVLITSTILTTH